MAFKNIIVLGAGGNAGKKILPHLINSPVAVTVLSRPDSTSTFPEGVKVVKSEYDVESLKAAFKGQDVVVSLVGGPAIATQTTAIDAAIAAGVQRFIPSEFGSDTNLANVVEQVPVFAAKRATVEHLKQNEDKIEWTGMITGFFFDLCLQLGLMGFDFKTKTATIFDGGNVPTATTTLDDVGRAVAGVIAHPAETKNRYVHTATFVATQNDMLAAVEKATGDSYTSKAVDVEPFRTEHLEKFNKGDFSAVVPLLQAHIFGIKSDADFSQRYQLQNDLFGLPKHDMVDVVKKALAEM